MTTDTQATSYFRDVTQPAVLIGGRRNGMQWATCTQHGPFAVPTGVGIACDSCPPSTPAILR